MIFECLRNKFYFLHKLDNPVLVEIYSNLLNVYDFLDKYNLILFHYFYNLFLLLIKYNLFF